MTSACRSCGAEILWVLTANQKRMPVDALPVENGNLVLDPANGDVPHVRVVKAGEGTHVSHYVTCPQREEWRK